MSTGVSIFLVPALIALLIKLFVLFSARSNGGTSTIFFSMVLVFACHNVAELLGILEFFRGDHFVHILKWYYVMTICAAALMLLYAKEVSALHVDGAKSKVVDGVIYGIALGLTLATLFTNAIVAGAADIGYMMTAVRGSFYWSFQVFAMSAFISIAAYLVLGYKKADSHLTEIQCSYTMFALAPILIASAMLIILMAMGIKINAALVLPVTTAMFLIITLRGERKHSLTDIRRHVPYSLERQTSNQIMDIFSSYAQDEVTYREGMAEIEKLLVMHKHEKHGGNVSTTAASMDIPRSSLYSIFRRLDIVVKDQK